MALKTIEYTVDTLGISPKTTQDGGVQGSHNVVELSFALSEDLRSALASVAYEDEESVLRYRFDGHSGAGAVLSTEPQELEDLSDPLVYSLENWITRDGGNILVYLVITLLKDEETEIELYSFPAALRIQPKPEGYHSDQGNYESITTLYEVTKENAEIAENAKDVSVDAMERTELAKTAIERDSTFIFDGGTAQGSAYMDLVIDPEVNSSSHNPVENKSVYAYVESVKDSILTSVSSSITSAISSLRSEMNSKMRKRYPIGSLWFSLENKNPGSYDVLGFGTWQRIKGRVLWAADTNDRAGDTGGNKTVTLSIENLPQNMGSFKAYAHDTITSDNPPAVTGIVSASYNTNPPTRFQFDTSAQGSRLYAKYELSGEGQPIDIMPPFIVVYVWRRTA